MTSASELSVRWRKSSYSTNGGDCIEIGEGTTRWRKSSYSTNGGNCVEIGEGTMHVVPVRDSKDPHGPALTFTTEGWADFVSAVKGGEFSA